MSSFSRTFVAETMKLRHSSMVWATVVAFGLAPVMGGVFMVLLSDKESMAQGSGLATKAEMMHFTTTWSSYFDILTQAMGVGGILVFGFVASWIFGREYAEGTAKDLLALPASRSKILLAKFVVFTIWCISLALANIIIAAVIGFFVGLPALEGSAVVSFLNVYVKTTLMTILVVFPVAFFALYGRGYLAPLAMVALMLVFAQVIAASGYGTYFPWSIPGLYSGAGGEYRNILNGWSYGLVGLTGISGLLATMIYWNAADQSK